MFNVNEDFIIADEFCGNCVIVYPKYSDNDLDSAYYIQKAVIEKSGYLPDIIDDGQERTCPEIIVGMTKREASQEVLKKLAYNQYAIEKYGEDVVVTGKSPHSTEMAAHRVFDYIKKEAKEGIMCDIPKNIQGVFNAGKWAYAPDFDGGEFYGIMESRNASYYILYNKCSENDYRNYLAKLEANGFSKEFCKEVANTTFATYAKGESLINCYYIKTLGEVRIAVDNTNCCYFITQAENDAEKSEKGDNEVLFAQLGRQEAYVCRLADGRFIVIDGGFVYDEFVERLHDYFVKYNTREKITVAAWLFSHAHVDHIGTFIGYSKKYGGETEVENIIVNNPSKMTLNASKEDNGTCADSMQKRINEFYASIPFYLGKKNMINAHAGQTYVFCGVTINMLITQEDLYPQPMKVTNGSSLCFDMIYKGQRFMFLNDIYTTQTKPLVKMYSSSLKSDIVQNAHHGYRGATDELYRLIDADFAIWNENTEGYNARKHNPFNIYSVKRAKENLIPEGNEVMVLKLPYKEGSAKEYVREK